MKGSKNDMNEPIKIICHLCGKVTEEFGMYPYNQRNYFVCSECEHCVTLAEVRRRTEKNQK